MNAKIKGIRPSAVLDADAIMEAVQEDENAGFCRACGDQTSVPVEPDAECYRCESCGENEVFGAEQLLLMGYAGGY